MDDRPVDVFFYGLFMDEQALIDQGLSPSNPRIAEVKQFDIHIGARATLVPAPGKSVWGLVMAMTHHDLNRLYAAPSVSSYRPETIAATLTSAQTIPALCYNLAKPDNSAPDRNYARRLAALATQLEFPHDYVTKLQTFADTRP